MAWSDLAVAAARALHLVGVMSVAGALAFRLLVAPFPLARVLRPSLAVALAAGALWLLLLSGELAGAISPAGMLAAVPTVVLHTWFGHVFLARLLPLLLAAWLARGGWLVAACICAAAAVALQAAIGHAAASADLVLLGSIALHLLAVSAWLGGLLPLFLALDAPSPARVARRFSVLGLLAVATIVATGIEQAAVLIGGLPGLVGTAYGRVALVKIVLLLVLLALATVNRFVFTPALDRSPGARRHLRISLAVEIGLGLAVILAASSLASLPPAIHEQPEWPFPLQFSLDFATDPDLRAEVTRALAALAGAAVVVALSLVLRRWRLAALVAAAAIGWFAVPHLNLLLVPAYPTTFYTSLTDFDAFGIAHGARLYARTCAGCHGAEGRGDGPLAKTLDIPPADLTADHLWAHSDGEVYWFLSHGIESPRGGMAMPGFAGVLDSDARWVLIDFLRARNAGDAMRAGGTWPHPIPAPELEAPCGDGRVTALEELRGQPVRIVVGPPAASPGVATIFIDPARPVAGTCVAAAAEVRSAYALVAGVAPAALAGTIFLVDPVGWLRARILPSDPPPDIPALIRRIVANPVAVPRGIGHHHQEE